MPPLECQFCGTPVTIGEPIPRDSECESCGHDLRCCRNCRHWDPRYNNECTETMADPVEDKTRRNFCEYFYFNRAPYVADSGGQARAADARAKLAGLFKEPSAAKEEARDKLAKLFGESAQKKPLDPRAKLDALFRKPEPGNEAEPEK
jgi:hypothetical protein